MDSGTDSGSGSGSGSLGTNLFLEPLLCPYVCSFVFRKALGLFFFLLGWGNFFTTPGENHV